MTQDIQALTVGVADVYFNDERVGSVRDVEIEKRVERIRHESPAAGELSADKSLTLRRSYTLRFTFDEADPPTMNKALGSPGLTQEAALPNQSMTEYVRLFDGAPFPLKYAASGLVAKNLAGDVTYVRNVDYTFDETRGTIARIATGAIPQGVLIKASYTYTLPASLSVGFGASPIPRTAKIELVHTYPDGASKMRIVLWKVELDGALTLALAEKDWWGVPFEGAVLADASEPDEPYGRIAFEGALFAAMGVSDGNRPYGGMG
jgi:hypothetical protein